MSRNPERGANDLRGCSAETVPGDIVDPTAPLKVALGKTVADPGVLHEPGRVDGAAVAADQIGAKAQVQTPVLTTIRPSDKQGCLPVVIVLDDRASDSADRQLGHSGNHVVVRVIVGEGARELNGRENVSCHGLDTAAGIVAHYSAHSYHSAHGRSKILVGSPS